ncbi:NUDIX domain-containing protein [Amycolatopsis roodepoortensis]|uniref:NUDIX domain-containing protein n=1 Tax=Amycolatopsis roodepoortensis TaxID=700274 RepID=UPI00214C398C|nr:NUDIX domain-containing protein [Amycolatopsis roodepoortensis]UUV32357.1 NUDIX domain-containing protein [Amycolatopsis roodepoortensis]
MTAPQYVFDTKHDRYPLAVHVFLIQEIDRGCELADKQVLLMRRAGSGYADGQLGLPAGHVDLGETPTECAIRELGEELGIELRATDLTPGATWFRMSQEPRMDIFYTARSWEGTPQIREPHKCTELVWTVPNVMPADALEFLAPAWNDTQNGRVLREYGFARTLV